MSFFLFAPSPVARVWRSDARTLAHAISRTPCDSLILPEKTLKNSACYAGYIVLPKRGNLISITVIQYQVSYGSVQKKIQFIFDLPGSTYTERRIAKLAVTIRREICNFIKFLSIVCYSSDRRT